MVDAVTAAATAPAAGVYNIFDGAKTYAEFMRRYAVMAGSRLRHSSAGVARARSTLRGMLENWLGLPPDLATEALRASRRPTPVNPDQAVKAARELGWRPRISLDEGMEIIQRSNGFHRSDGRESNPWKENEEWGEQ